MELLRWVDGKNQKENASLPFPQLISFILEQFNINSTGDMDNRKCLPIEKKNLGKMGVSGLLVLVHVGQVHLGLISHPLLVLLNRKWNPTVDL